MVTTRGQGSRVDGAVASITVPENQNGNAPARNTGRPPRPGTDVGGSMPRRPGQSREQEEPVIEEVPTPLEMFTQVKELQARLRRAEDELRVAREAREVNSHRVEQTEGNYTQSVRSQTYRSHTPATPTLSVAPTRRTGSISRGPERPVENRRRECDYGSFLKCKPAEFNGGYDPVKNIRWVKEMEIVFEACDCSDDKKVVFASRLLKGEAMDWWTITRDALGPMIMAGFMWDMFKDKFMPDYCMNRDSQRLEEEFLTLKKGSMSIHEYARVFTEKLGFVGHLVRDDVTRVR